MEDMSNLQLLFNFYSSTSPPLSSMALECLVRSAALLALLLLLLHQAALAILTCILISNKKMHHDHTQLDRARDNHCQQWSPYKVTR